METINILVVEDEKIVAIDIKRRLTSLGYNVIAAVSSGEKAIEVAAVHFPDLILMDIMLEGKLDGIETAQQIKDKYAIPVIFLTAYTDEKTIQRAKTAEPFGYILKPFEIRDLRSTIEIALYKAETQKKLRESEQWLNTVLNSIGEAVIAVDANNKIKFMNPLAEVLTAVPISKAIGRPLSEVYRTEIEMSDEYLIYCLAEGNKTTMDALIDNKILVSVQPPIPIEDNYVEIKDQRERIVGSVLTFRDISSRRKVESSIIASRNYYLSLFEEFPALIWRSGKDGRFNYFNRTWLDFTGRAIEDEIEFGWMDYLLENEKGTFYKNYRKDFDAKRAFEYEIRLSNSKNEYRWLVCFGSPLYDINKRFTGFIGLCYDITERKRMENEIKEAKNKAEQSSKAKSTFLSNMSHEIRTPMNGIIGLTEILLDTNLSPEQKNYLDLLRKSAFSLLNMLNSVLDYSKYEAGKLKLENTVLNLYMIIEEVFRIFLPEIQNKNIELICDVEPDIPSELLGDSQRIKQVLVNLIGNAVKFTEKGKITLSVKLDKVNISETGRKKKKIPLHFIVKDTGIGIAEEKQRIVFEGFTQADSSTTKKYGGTGIGLTISKQIVEMMGGEIWFESKSGLGTTFHFKIELENDDKQQKMNIPQSLS
ncbi:MAG: ATP-binding protein [Bacteroidota bacterium]|nr:ATP-binding protein [Bacteroidota bacterium]MDP4190221.1 ATP-binding protein [Bacteroidota bacterium]MDP4195526.1 ATP-binding protein [Bacteroidota bacterium]